MLIAQPLFFGFDLLLDFRCHYAQRQINIPLQSGKSYIQANSGLRHSSDCVASQDITKLHCRCGRSLH